MLRLLDKLFEFCASLKLAILLILSLAAYLAAATFYESRYGVLAAQAVVYSDKLFLVLMALLSVNVMAAVVIRYPWKRKQTGFIITHFGIEVLLVGCLISYRASVDGHVTFAVDAAAPHTSPAVTPTDSINLNSEQIGIWVGGGAPVEGSPDARAFDEFHAVPVDFWRAAGYPSLPRFVAGVFKPLPEPIRWPAGRTVTFDVRDDVRVEVLEWLAAAKPTAGGRPIDGFVPADVAPNKMVEADRAMRVAVTVDGQRSEHWLGLGMAGATAQTPRGPVVVAYRYQPHDLPFRLECLDARRVNDPGSNNPAALITAVRATPAGGGQGVEHRVRLNDPLTYAGLTFYQSHFRQQGTRSLTTLSVRRDPGWVVKYAGCGFIVLGIFTMFYMKAYFQKAKPTTTAAAAQVCSDTDYPDDCGRGIPHSGGTGIPACVAWLSPGTFLSRAKPCEMPVPKFRAASGGKNAPAQPPDTDKNVCATGKVVMALAVLAVLSSDAHGGKLPTVDITPIKSLPVLDNGRVKPFDTVAREFSRIVTGRERFVRETEPAALVLDWAVRPEAWQDRPLLEVPLIELRRQLGMKEADRWIAPAALRADAPFAATAKDLASRREGTKRTNEQERFTRLEQATLDLDRRLAFFDAAARARFAVVPPPRVIGQVPEGEGWVPLAVAPPPVKAAWSDLARAFEQGRSGEFAAAAGRLRAEIRTLAGDGYADESAMGREVFYNGFKPFRVAWVAYLMVLAALVAAALVRRPWAYRVALGMFATAVAFNAFAFILRCSITGWAPVTNMYETVVWVAMIAAVLSLVMSIIYRRPALATGGAVVAVLGGLVADVMPPEYGGAIRNLGPALRSNLWLSVHVLTIVSSYAAFALALVLGNVVLAQYLVRARRRRRESEAPAEPRLTAAPGVPLTAARREPRPPERVTLDESIRLNTGFTYRAVQVGVLLVAAGTILGGLWADQAWGRFWGWDPKEVWALVVLLTYLALLHGRFAGWVGPFGTAAGAALCFTSVLMSWYGVNFVLGAGLHTYGFGSGGFGYVAAYVAAQWAFVAVAWIAYRRSGAAAPAAREPEPSDLANDGIPAGAAVAAE